MNTNHQMFVIKVVNVCLWFHSVYCIFDNISDEKASIDFDSTKESSENKVMSVEQSKEGNLNSTIGTSVCKYQEIRAHEDTDEYKNTLIDYPYAASIQRQGSHYANGALVEKRWVLSSAGEFYNVRESIKLFRVRLGSVDCKRGGRVFPIISVQIHPSFIPESPSFDLALLKLAIPVTITLVINPIPLSMVKWTVVSAKFMTTYWPRIVVKEKVLPSSAKERIKFTHMRVSTQSLISSDICAGKVKKLDSSSLCLKPIEKYHSVCTPDAGAPVIARDGLWGITSGWVSPECPKNPGPTVFTRVATANVRSWIDSQLLS